MKKLPPPPAKPTSRKDENFLERIAIALEYISDDLKALRDMAEKVNKPRKNEFRK